MEDKRKFIIFAMSKETKCVILKKIVMATEKEWQEYFERLKLRIKIIEESNLPEKKKKEVIDELLDKMLIVKNYFLGESEKEN